MRFDTTVEEDLARFEKYEGNLLQRWRVHQVFSQKLEEIREVNTLEAFSAIKPDRQEIYRDFFHMTSQLLPQVLQAMDEAAADGRLATAATYAAIFLRLSGDTAKRPLETVVPLGKSLSNPSPRARAGFLVAKFERRFPVMNWIGGPEGYPNNTSASAIVLASPFEISDEVAWRRSAPSRNAQVVTVTTTHDIARDDYIHSVLSTEPLKNYMRKYAGMIAEKEALSAEYSALETVCNLQTTTSTDTDTFTDIYGVVTVRTITSTGTTGYDTCRPIDQREANRLSNKIRAIMIPPKPARYSAKPVFKKSAWVRGYVRVKAHIYTTTHDFEQKTEERNGDVDSMFHRAVMDIWSQQIPKKLLTPWHKEIVESVTDEEKALEVLLFREAFVTQNVGRIRTSLRPDRSPRESYTATGYKLGLVSKDWQR